LSSIEITWLGHATVDVRLGSTRLVTDPILRDRVAHLRRHDGTARLDRDDDDQTPTPVDAVLISHLHHDHLDLASLRRLPAGTALVVPRGGARVVAGHAPGDVVELSVDDELTVGDVRITAVPAEHHSGRFLSRARAAPLGFVMEHADGVVYFPGDSDLHPAMADLPAPDVALLPIWGWGPTLGSGHLDPERAAQAAAILRARAVLPVHWGTFAPILPLPGRPGWLDRPAGAFTDAMARHAPDARLDLVRPGPDPITFPTRGQS
jgi:L-ascorbate metabolism protein UlaG (beta-lactamase superfamily)